MTTTAKMKRLMMVLPIAAAILLPGCATHMDVAEGFVRLDDPGFYDVKAISADGVSVAARRVSVPGDSTLEFWAQAVGNELTAQGYAPQPAEAITSDAGQPGKLLWFSREIQGRAYTYATALYVRGSRLLLAEAGGPADAFEQHEPAIRQSLRSAR